MIQKKKFVKTFRNTKTVQLILLLLLETAYVLVLTLNPALGTKLFEDRTLFILCTLSWILALFNLIWLLYDFYKLRTFAEESHALNRAAFLDHLTGIPNRHGLDVVFETYDSGISGSCSLLYGDHHQPERDQPDHGPCRR